MIDALGLGTGHPTVVAVNGHRRWYNEFKGEPNADRLLSWLDDIKLGDVKKSKLPKGFWEPNAEEEEEEEEVKPPVQEEEQVVFTPPVEEVVVEEVDVEIPVESLVEEARDETPVKEDKPASDGHDEL